MDDEQRLKDLVQYKKREKKNKEVLLGEVLGNIFKNQISPGKDIYDMISQAWQQLLPEQLRQHCEIVEISAGRVKVVVDNPSYLHEFRLCSYQLVEDLQKLCPRAKVKKIEFALN